MNTNSFLTVTAWQTRNWRHAKLAGELCRNYGMQPSHKTLYIGVLNFKERVELEGKLSKIFAKSHERLSIFMLCRSCSRGATMEENFRDMAITAKEKTFEMIQQPKMPLFTGSRRTTSQKG